MNNEKTDYGQEIEDQNTSSQISEDNQMEETHAFREWLRRNKIVILGSVVGIGIGGVLIFKNKKSLKRLFSGARQSLGTLDKNSLTEKVIDASIDAKKGLVDDIVVSGERLTARGIGDKMLCSAQMVNKRIIREGFAVRLPNGDLIRTELGAKFGEDVVKTTRYGHTFSNIEWSESIIPLIFSKEEIDMINQFKERTKEIMLS